MSTHLSDRTKRIKPSATMAVNAKATELKSQGVDIINLSVGEPDFPTPATIKQAGIDAINNDITRYTAADGLPALKDAITHKLKRDNQLEYAANEIIVTPGAKQALFNAMMATVNAGDEVIIPAPYWVSYEAMVELTDGKPIIVQTTAEARFKLTPDLLESNITDKTKLLVLNSPSNPTGMVYTKEEYQALGDVLERHPNIVIVVDDIYEYILWGQTQFTSFLNACPQFKDRTILINGVSKAYAMTGWRIGYSAAPEPFTKAMKKVQSHSTSCACSISQVAAIKALEMPYRDLNFMYQKFHERHDLVVEGLNEIAGVTTYPADGAFYVFPHVQPVIDRLGLEDDIALANHVLEKAHVATVPGTAFGTPGFLRISCAASNEALAEAVNRLKKQL